MLWHAEACLIVCSKQCRPQSSVVYGPAVAIRCCSVPGCTAAVSRGAKLPAAVCGPAQSNYSQHSNWRRSGCPHSQAAAAGQKQAAAARQAVQTQEQTAKRHQPVAVAGQCEHQMCADAKQQQPAQRSVNSHVQIQTSSSCMLICTAPGVLIGHTSNTLWKLLQMNAHPVGAGH